MRALAPLLIALVASACLLSACNGDDAKAAKAKKLKELRAEMKLHQQSRAALADNWSAVRLKVMPARSAWKRAKGTGEEDALKEAYDAANAAAKAVEKEENAWNRKRIQLEDAIRAAGG